MSDNLRTPVTASYTLTVLSPHTATIVWPATATCVKIPGSALIVLRIGPQVVRVLEDDTCRVVKSSPKDEWPSKNCRRRMEVSGDRGKAVWYMCRADA